MFILFNAFCFVPSQCVLLSCSVLLSCFVWFSRFVLLCFVFFCCLVLFFCLVLFCCLVLICCLVLFRCLLCFGESFLSQVVFTSCSAQFSYSCFVFPPLLGPVTDSKRRLKFKSYWKLSKS